MRLVPIVVLWPPEVLYDMRLIKEIKDLAALIIVWS